MENITGSLNAFVNAAPAAFVALLVLLALWSIVWKGIALWKAARLSHMKWFIVLLVVNTIGILEIIYIFLVAKKSESAARTDVPRP